MVKELIKKIKNFIKPQKINKEQLLHAYYKLKNDPRTVYPKKSVQEMFKKIGITLKGNEARFKDICLHVPIDIDDHWGYRGHHLIFVLDKIVNNDKELVFLGTIEDINQRLDSIIDFIYLSN